MSDYSNLSDDELDKRLAAAQGKAAPAAQGASPYANLTDDELDQRLADAERSKDAPEVIQEMHPDFTAPDRLIVKNFTTGDEAAVGYLKQRHPNLDIDTDPNSGQIRAKAKGVNEPYKVLDPDKGFFGNLNPLSGEFYRDLGDIGYDVTSGVTSGVATAAGGLGGAVAGPVGALGGAAAAGGASSAALEGLRQKLGNALGVEQEFDPTQVGIAGAAGLASPLLFGTGGQVGGKLGKAILGDLGEEAAQVAQASQRGAIGYGVDNIVKPVASRLGGFLSGVGYEPLETLGRKFETVEAMRKDPEGVLTFIDETGDELNNQFEKTLSERWGKVESAMANAGADSVDATPVRQRLEGEIARLEELSDSGGGTEASKDLLDRLKDAFEHHFQSNGVEEVPVEKVVPSGYLDLMGNPTTKTVTEMVEQPVKKNLGVIGLDAAVELEAKLSELAEFQSIKSNQVAGNRLKNFSRDDKKVANLGAELKKMMSEQFEAVAPGTSEARKAYGEVANLRKDINAIVQNPRQAFSNLKNADITSNLTNKQLFHKVDRVVGSKLQERSRLATAAEIFGPGRKSIFSGDIMKRAPAALAGGAIGQYLDRTSGSGSGYAGGLAGMATGAMLGGPAAMRRYIQMGLKAGQFNQGMGPLRPAVGKAVLEETMSPWMGVQ